MDDATFMKALGWSKYENQSKVISSDNTGYKRSVELNLGSNKDFPNNLSQNDTLSVSTI